MRWVLSWFFYGLGHIFSKPMMRWDWSWLYPVYSRLMVLSTRVQGESLNGPWGPSAMKPPQQCDLWSHPERIAPRTWPECFEHLETFEEASQWRRQLFKCKECGQLYFHEFCAEGGDDPQSSTFIPIYTDQDTERLKTYDHVELLKVFPQLHRDDPKGAGEPKAYWLTEPPRTDASEEGEEEDSSASAARNR